MQALALKARHHIRGESLMRPVVARNVNEANHVAREESCKAKSQCCFTWCRPLLRCLLLIVVYLAVLTARVLCSDQSNVSPASTSESKTAAVARLTKRSRQVLYGGDLVTNLLEVTALDEARLNAATAEDFG